MEEKPIAVFDTGLLGPPVVARLYQDEIAVVHGGHIRTEQRIRYEQIAQVVVRKGLQRSSLIIERTGGTPCALTDWVMLVLSRLARVSKFGCRMPAVLVRVLRPQAHRLLLLRSENLPN